MFGNVTATHAPGMRPEILTGFRVNHHGAGGVFHGAHVHVRAQEDVLDLRLLLVSARHSERERVREGESVCVCERERECVCVCVRESERERERERESEPHTRPGGGGCARLASSSRIYAPRRVCERGVCVSESVRERGTV